MGVKLAEDISEGTSISCQNLLEPAPVWPVQQELRIDIWGNFVAPVAVVQHVGGYVEVTH